MHHGDLNGGIYVLVVIIEVLRREISKEVLTFQSSLSCISSGNFDASHLDIPANIIKTTYTAFPWRRLRSFENAKSEVAKVGPMARVIDAEVWEKPLIAPRTLFAGAEALINMRAVAALERVTCEYRGVSF
jgi:hypothetical protein